MKNTPTRVFIGLHGSVAVLLPANLAQLVTENAMGVDERKKDRLYPSQRAGPALSEKG